MRGAGYRGKFGGEGWDGMWTDMSEIVRPTRDGIHGREFISTVVDVGSKPVFLEFNEDGDFVGQTPQTFEIQLPVVFDLPPVSVVEKDIYKTFAETANELDTLAIIPIGEITKYGLESENVVPLIEVGEEGAYPHETIDHSEAMGGIEEVFDAVARPAVGEQVMTLLERSDLVGAGAVA